MNVTPIIVDIETCGLPNAADFLEPVQPDKRLKDVEKIKADIADKEQARIERLSLDWNVGRIVAMGWWTEQTGTVVRVCADEMEEQDALTEFWEESRHRTLVGFNLKGFDLRFMVQRSRYLRVPHPILDFSKYSRKGVTDLFIDLTFGDGTYDQGAMKRTLKAFCKRFEIPCEDGVSGSEIPALVAEGKWDQVAAHCRSDVELTVQLAHRLGIIREIPQPAEAVL
jgi:predicted PolB exonuclease-like 3'-5' exonuclease